MEIINAHVHKAGVPILDTETVFPAHELRDLGVEGTLEGAGAFHANPGHCSVFSFGAEAPAREESAR